MNVPARRLGRALTVGVLCWVLAAAARADEPDARARAQALLQDGNQRFRSDDVRGALAAYESAYVAFASPKLFFNMARCEEKLGERPRALQHFARFLVEAADAEPDDRADAEERVRALTAALGALELSGAPPNGAVQIDGVTAGITPLAAPLWVEPGPHRLSLDRAGRPLWVTTVQARPGEKLSLSVPADLPPPAPPKVDPPVVDQQPKPSRTRWWLWAGLGAVVVGGAVATFLVLRNDCPATTCR